MPKWELNSDESLALVGTEPRAWYAFEKSHPGGLSGCTFLTRAHALEKKLRVISVLPGVQAHSSKRTTSHFPPCLRSG